MSEQTITTEAMGRVETDPKSVHPTIEATAIADQTDTARQEAFDKATRIREKIQEASVDVFYLETVKSILTDSTDTVNSNLEDGQYKATERLSTECSPDAASKIVDVISHVDGLILTAKLAVPDDERRNLKSKAVTNAMAEAREIAEAIAAAENLDIVGVSQVRQPPLNEDKDPTESLKHGPGFNFHPHNITIAERVTVTHAVEPRGSTR